MGCVCVGGAGAGGAASCVAAELVRELLDTAADAGSTRASLEGGRLEVGVSCLPAYDALSTSRRLGIKLSVFSAVKADVPPVEAGTWMSALVRSAS
mmetsp:Transcript_86064/g.229679  ORF Transcript_86064/g.229679 Transcript_86064/m.229679 type:complete len:96 (-) Transcript_86064:876-1163(-)